MKTFILLMTVWNSNVAESMDVIADNMDAGSCMVAMVTLHEAAQAVGAVVSCEIDMQGEGE